jgi:hypothetical protein
MVDNLLLQARQCRVLTDKHWINMSKSDMSQAEITITVKLFAGYQEAYGVPELSAAISSEYPSGCRARSSPLRTPGIRTFKGNYPLWHQLRIC